MRMGQGVRTGLGHGGITCVLQTQFSSFVLISFPVFLFQFLFCYILERKDKKWFKRDIIVLISFLILFVSISFLVNIGKEMFLPGFRRILYNAFLTICCQCLSNC